MGAVSATITRTSDLNLRAGKWSLLADHGTTADKTAPGGPSLDGLQIGKRYCFKCAEVTELDPWPRDQKKLYLQSIETTGITRKRPWTPSSTKSAGKYPRSPQTNWVAVHGETQPFCSA